jgi:hypothetical protein
MKFLQLVASYPEYGRDFLAQNPDFSTWSYAEQNARLVNDGYSLVHLFGRYLGAPGFESQIVFTDIEPSQKQWLKEQGLSLRRPEHWRHEIAALQVNAAKPDVLYITEPVGFDRRFLDLLDPKPRLVLAWKAAAIPEGTDWRGFDVILSNFLPTIARARDIGAKDTAFLTPGFPATFAEELPVEPKFLDVSFIGSVSSEHPTRNAYLEFLARATVTNRDGFELGYYIRTAEPHLVPPAVRARNRGALWGRGMYRALKGSRIAINIGIDLAKGETGNMRMIEAAGLGTFLLTEHKDNIRNYFEPGVEVETFTSPAELEAKVRYFLHHEDKREAIAARGRERCRRDFSMERSLGQFTEIIRQHLR